MTRIEMLAAKIPFCIYCGKPGAPGRIQREGELHHGNMVGPGPGHSPDDFPGDPTGTKYFGAGAGAYVYFHPGCTPEKGETIRKNEAFIADYNALIAKHGKMIASYDDEWPDRIADVDPETRARFNGDDLVYVDKYGLDSTQRGLLTWVKEKNSFLLSERNGVELAKLVTMGFLDPPPAGGDGHHVLTAKGLAALEKS